MGDVCSRLAWFLSDNSGIESANEIHVRRREIIIINRCPEIYSRRNSTRRAVTLLITAKPNVQYDLLHRCVTPQLSLLLFCFVPFHYDMMTWNLLRHSFSLKGLVQSSKKSQRKRNHYSVIEQNALSGNYMENIIKCSHPKMTGQNDQQDESVTGQVHNQAGHCLLTGHYFEPSNVT